MCTMKLTLKLLGDESLDPSLWNISTRSQCGVPLGGKTQRVAELGFPLLPDFSIVCFLKHTFNVCF